MREYRQIDIYLNKLTGQIYSQPPDEGHQAAIEDVLKEWMPMTSNIKSILDVGCGQGQAIPILKKYANRVVGITLGEDAAIAKKNGYDVRCQDMTFLDFKSGEFDMIFARHCLEHSPMPLLTLMEWERVGSNLLLLVVPTYIHYGPRGQNHYYVLLPEQWKNLLDVAGWEIVWEDKAFEEITPFEHRWMCQKRGL